MCQHDVEEEDREWQLVESPQKAQHMLEYVTNAFVSTVWTLKLAQAGNKTPTFGDVLTEWEMREVADWLLVEAPQEVQHILE